MEDITIEKIFEFAEKLDSIAELKAKKIAASIKEEPYESTETQEINTALSKAQGEFKPIKFNRVNNYLSQGYADLAEIAKETNPILEKNGLGYTQQIKISDDGITTLVTKLRHSSGQFINSKIRIIPAKNDIKNYESTLNQHRKLSLCTLLGITFINDEGDDDGETTMVDTADRIATALSQKDVLKAKEDSYEAITKEQLQDLQEELENYPEIAEQILDRLHLVSLADMPKKLYGPSAKRIREIKEIIKKSKPSDV